MKLQLLISRYERHLKTGFFLLYVVAGIYFTRGAEALPATSWMQIFSYRDYTGFSQVLTYLRDLRTGIPPVLSLMELVESQLMGHIKWNTHYLYRFCMVLMLVLPLLLTKSRLGVWMVYLGAAWAFLLSIPTIHLANAQLYDVTLPFFILMWMVLGKYSLSDGIKSWQMASFSLLAGFFLSMAELSRPFFLLILPFCLLYMGFLYFRANQRRLFVWFLLPILLFSGGWHLKLFLLNEGQVIWSNHGGTNLFHAWSSLVDHEALKARLQPEAPPLNDFGWAWNNINTEIHAQNSAVMSQAVKEAILSHPQEALGLFLKKALHFVSGPTRMYDHNPQSTLLSLYSLMVRFLYLLMALLLGRSLFLAFRRPFSLPGWGSVSLWTGFFLTLMPIIGESGEESRFLITVLPFLLHTGLQGAELIQSLRKPVAA